MISANKSHWKRHGNGKKLSTVVQPSCELLFLLRLADFNVVHPPWGQSSGKSADLSNNSFFCLSSYLDMRVKWEVSSGSPSSRQLSQSPCTRHVVQELCQGGRMLPAELRGAEAHWDFPPCRRAVLLATLWAGAEAAHQLGTACGDKMVPVTGLVTVCTGHGQPVRPDNPMLWVQCAVRGVKWNC